MKPWRLEISFATEVMLADGSSNHLMLTISDDAYGDSETGYGAVLGVDMTREQVIAVRDEMNRWLEANEA